MRRDHVGRRGHIFSGFSPIALLLVLTSFVADILVFLVIGLSCPVDEGVDPHIKQWEL